MAWLCCLALPVPAQEIPVGTAWHEASVTLLDADFPHTGFHARWEYFQCPCGDILIRLEQSAPDGVLTGELVLVHGRVIAARGPVGQSEDLELVMQAPILMVQLAFGLLQRAVPGGPAAVNVARDISVTEPKIPVEIDTGMATGHFAAPWSVTGRIWPAGSARRRFDLDFQFSGPAPDVPGGSLDLIGGQDFGLVAYPLTDETPLAGWRLQWISGEPAGPQDPPAGQTLGELRAAAKARTEP